MEKHNPMEAFGWYANMKEAVVKQYLRGEITRGEMQRKLADIEMEKKRGVASETETCNIQAY